MTRVVKKTVEHANLEKYAMLSFDFDKSEVNEPRTEDDQSDRRKYYARCQWRQRQWLLR